MKKSLFLFLAVSLLAFAGCAKQKAPASSSVAASSTGSSSLPEPEKKPPEPPVSQDVTMSDARNLLAETIDTDTYMLLDAKTNLEIAGEGYYVFIVANREDNKAVGQVAVSKKTGEKYNYEGGNHLGDYSEFSLYDPETDAVYDWEGSFTDGTQQLELVPIDDNSFEYSIGEIRGTAKIQAAAAEDTTNNITFTWDKDAEGALTLSGAVEGIFSPAAQ